MNIKIVNKNTKDSNFLQSNFWAKVKEKYGWKSIFVEIEEKDITVLFLYRKIFKVFNIVYCGRPDLLNFNNDELSKLSKFVEKQIKGKVLFIRYDFKNIDVSNFKLKKANTDIQVPNTVVIYKKDEETLLAEMKSKTRYNVRLAARKDVVITEVELEQLDKWYDLYETTAKRDKIAIHSYDYYKDVVDLANEHGEGSRIYFAKHEEDILAGIIVLYHNKEATYLYGASSNHKRNLMPAYLLQWQAMSDAFENGMESYDMFGIPKTDDPRDPMHGLYRFKTGFGGEIEHYAGCYDYTKAPISYNLFKLAEKARTFIYKKLLKR